ncbi:hypothetical protein SESBI_30416 [Sesbania bispinosa]|nr:hypothetical protein SESBI_30416 [Sesbania bispinosa]
MLFLSNYFANDGNSNLNDNSLDLVNDLANNQLGVENSAPDLVNVCDGSVKLVETNGTCLEQLVGEADQEATSLGIGPHVGLHVGAHHVGAELPIGSYIQLDSGPNMIVNNDDAAVANSVQCGDESGPSYAIMDINNDPFNVLAEGDGYFGKPRNDELAGDARCESSRPDGVPLLHRVVQESTPNNVSLQANTVIRATVVRN